MDTTKSRETETNPTHRRNRTLIEFSIRTKDKATRLLDSYRRPEYWNLRDVILWIWQVYADL